MWKCLKSPTSEESTTIRLDLYLEQRGFTNYT